MSTSQVQQSLMIKERGSRKNIEMKLTFANPRLAKFRGNGRMQTKSTRHTHIHRSHWSASIQVKLISYPVCYLCSSKKRGLACFGCFFAQTLSNISYLSHLSQARKDKLQQNYHDFQWSTNSINNFDHNNWFVARNIYIYNIYTHIIYTYVLIRVQVCVCVYIVCIVGACFLVTSVKDENVTSYRNAQQRPTSQNDQSYKRWTKKLCCPNRR